MRLERLPEVIARTSLSRAHLYNLISRDLFPRPKRVGKRAVAWLSQEIDEWIETRPPGGSWRSTPNG
jgi:prophage regulatory protein